MNDVIIGGRKGCIHFIRFPTSEMANFLALAKSKGMALLASTVCATGGGAFKFENDFYEVRLYSCFCHEIMKDYLFMDYLS
jgi:type II pantothenate kinase